jgi:iron complex transport system substrate-binding protein
MPRWWRTAALALALMLAATACGEAREQPLRSPPAETAFPVTLTDDEGVEVTVEAQPQRIVTFAPSHTEILFALGLGERVVGVSGPFDDFPPQASRIEPVAGAGGTEPNIEKVVALEPDLLLTAFIGGEWKDRLRELGVPVFTTLASSFEDALEDIETVGRLTGAAEEAGTVTRRMQAKVETITAQAQSAGSVTCFLELSDLFTVGPGALEFDLLQRAGCEPITADAGQPYPQWSPERLVRDDPDVFLASEYGQPVAQVADRPGIRDLRAVREGRLFLVDGDLISRPGPRLVEGIAELAEALHPDLF